ncbi:MAG: 2-oxoacid:ferredoxin oxidoreductase subunit gamma [Nitrososphaeria archaeon]
MRYETRIAGFGGQGVVTAGYILGRAACLFDKKNATQTQSYGPEARGGACTSEVVISEDLIDYPKVIKPDVLVAMSQEAYSQYYQDVKDGGIIILDKDLVSVENRRKDVRYHEIPSTAVAERLGNKIVANIVMLGTLVALTGVVSKEAIRQSVEDRFPKQAELNLRALEEGRNLATVN